MSTIKIIEDISWCFKWLTHSLGKKVKKWAQDCGPNFRDCSFFDTQFRSKTFCDFMDRNLVKVHKPREKKNVVNIQVCLVTKRVIICRIRHRFLHDKAGFTAHGQPRSQGFSLGTRSSSGFPCTWPLAEAPLTCFYFLPLPVTSGQAMTLKLSSQKNKNRNA